MKDILIGILCVFTLSLLIYVFSRIQMMGWLHGIEKRLKDKFENKFENKPFKTEEK